MRSQLVPRLAAVALLAFALSACGGSSAVHPMSKGDGASFQLPISAFTSAQGQFTIPNTNTAGNFGLAWRAENSVPGCPDGETLYNLLGVVDYAGLINNYLVANNVKSLGTTQTGTVIVQPQTDGTAVVNVDLRTTDAFTDVTCFFPATKTQEVLLGHFRADVATGLTAALGSSEVRATFVMPTPTSPLPDLLQLSFYANTLPGYSLTTINFHATATGPLSTLFGVPDGTPGTMSLAEQGTMKAVTFGEDQDGYSAEQLNLNIQK